MITYVVVDTEDRDKFEKENEIPYGYGGCWISHSLMQSIEYIDSLPTTMVGKMVVERWESGESEVVFEGKWLLYDIEELPSS